MHEVSLVHAMFDQADRAIGTYDCSSVQAITVRVGEMAGVEPELFRTAFDGCREERGYVHATLVLVVEATSWICTACGAEVDGRISAQCAACDAPARLRGGNDITLDRLELEVPHV